MAHAIVSVDGNNVFRLSAEDTVIVSKSKYFVEIIDISGGSFFLVNKQKAYAAVEGISGGRHMKKSASEFDNADCQRRKYRHSGGTS